MKSSNLAMMACLAGAVLAAPAPAVVTVYEVVTEDAPAQTAPVAAAAAPTTYPAAVPTTAISAAAAVPPPAAPAPATTSASGPGFNLDSLLSTNLSKWLAYFGFGSGLNTAVTTTAAAPAYTSPVAAAYAPAASSSQYSPPAASYAAPVQSQLQSQSSLSSGDISNSPGLDQSFALAILAAHNTDRAAHGAGPLTWNVDAYNYAQNNANNYDCSGVLTHTHGQYGENLAAGYLSGSDAVAAWYEEGQDYSYSAANTYNHFTQVVWKSTTSVGCAYKDCRSQGWGLYVICEYDPPGNVIGEEAANVLPN